MLDGLITLDCEQGTEEWLAARCGIPTATGISNIVTPTGNRGVISPILPNSLLKALKA